jgi:cell division transport system ATP-binding protein
MKLPGVPGDGHAVENRESIIRMFNVTRRFGRKVALDGISLDIRAGEFVFVTGPSGAGKSTLMKTLYLAETVSEGQIIVDGMNLARISRQRIPFLRRRFGVIFQDFKLIPNRSVFDNVALVLEAAGEAPSRIRPRVMQALKHAGIDHKPAGFPPSLSGGEQQRVAVARAVVGDPAIILADEPTGSLDHESARIIFNLLLDYNDRGTTVLVASHNTHLIEATPRGRIVALRDGALAT